jgi:hypothetical protein
VVVQGIVQAPVAATKKTAPTAAAALHARMHLFYFIAALNIVSKQRCTPALAAPAAGAQPLASQFGCFL